MALGGFNLRSSRFLIEGIHKRYQVIEYPKKSTHLLEGRPFNPNFLMGHPSPRLPGEARIATG